ncbi:MAG: tetratricopeptide repeat protein [Acidimicrobiia bacterium]
MTDRKHLEERREIAIRDLTELAEQVEAGEIDQATADTLRANYQAEVDEVETLLGELPPVDEKRSAGEATEPPGMQPRSTRRAVIGSVAVIAALSVAIFFAARDINPDAAESATDSASPGALTVDPNSVSNEQLEAVVAQNPDINAMRLALANRYFEEQDYGKALDHYLTVAENNPTPAEEGLALSRIGWMAYQTGQPEAAREYLDNSLTVDPTNQETKLFLGFVLLYGLDDAEGAIPLLEEIVAIPDLPSELLHSVEAALDEARNGGSG